MDCWDFGGQGIVCVSWEARRSAFQRLKLHS